MSLQLRLEWIAASFLVLSLGTRTLGGPPPGRIALQDDAWYHAFSADGQLLATTVASQDQKPMRVRLRDGTTGVVLSEADAGSEYPRFLTFSPDAQQLALVGWTRRYDKPPFVIRLWQITAEKKLTRPRTLRLDRSLSQGPSVFHCAFSPDGRTLAAATGSEVIYLWETATGQLRRRFQGGVAAGFSADGQSLIAVTHDGLVRRFAMPACKLSGPEETVPRTEFLYVSAVAFSRDGRRVAFHDDWTTIIKEVATGRTLCRVTLSDTILSASLSPDGKTLAALTGDGTHFLDTATGKERAWLQRADGQVDFLSGGNYLACYGNKSVIFRETAGVFARAAKAPEPPSMSPPGVSLEAELVTRTAAYLLNLDGDTPADFSNRIHFGEERPDPARVDLILKLRNTGKKSLKLRPVGDQPTLYLIGPGAINYPEGLRPTAFALEKRLRTLAPGETSSFRIVELQDGVTSFWLLPGEYRIAGYYTVAVSPAPQGADDVGDGFGYATLRVGPIKVQVEAGRKRPPPWLDEPPLPAPKPPAPGTGIVPKEDDVSQGAWTKLSLTTNFDGLDPGTPLQDALEYLTARYELPIRIDESAFKKRGKANLDKEKIAIQPIMNVGLRTVLQILLDPLDADIEVREGTVWVVPLPKPTSLAERLRRSSRWMRQYMELEVRREKGIPDRTPLSKALALLSERYDFAFYLDVHAFKRAGLKDVGSRPVKLAPRPKDVPLGTVLQEVLDQVRARFVLRDRLVLVIPAARK
jgi:hypothetical protein